MKPVGVQGGALPLRKNRPPGSPAFFVCVCFFVSFPPGLVLLRSLVFHSGPDWIIGAPSVQGASHCLFFVAVLWLLHYVTLLIIKGDKRGKEVKNLTLRQCGKSSEELAGR